MLLPVVIFSFSSLLSLAEPVSESPGHGLLSWAVEIDGGEKEAERLASSHGLINRGEVVNKHYHFDLVDRERASETITQSLINEFTVKSAHLQVVKRHVKRDYVVPPDPEWPEQWYLTNRSGNGVWWLNARVEQAWLQGYTGSGITAVVVDDGLDWKHIDLINNYDASVSYNFAANRTDPSPTSSIDNHGTQCAGVMAMSKNRDCGIGAAFQCKVGGIKINIEESYDVQEAKALNYQSQTIDVYSNSWGPTDKGFYVEGPGPFLSMVLEKNVKTGRNGRGSIYVWASGNGGDDHDSCAADGYVNSIYTIAVGSADQDGKQSFYDEDCSAKMAVTFSHNSEKDGPQLSATLLDGECTLGFTGTSASAPLLAGIIALILQANPDLTWRDVQYLIVYTSNPDIVTVDDLTTNGAGLKFSHSSGFGAIDAEAMITRARHWTNVPLQESATIPSNQSEFIVASGSSYEIEFPITSELCNISSLEHVVVSLSLSIILSPNDTIYNISDYLAAEAEQEGRRTQELLESKHPRRGDVKIELRSPSGTLSTLLPHREYDFINSEGYGNWSFMSVHFWGENPAGSWTLTTSFGSSSGSILFENVSLTLYGVSEPVEGERYRDMCDGCVRGCARGVCDVCPQLRCNETLECVNVCPNSTTEYAGYCIKGTVIYPPPITEDTSKTTIIIIATVTCVVVTILAGIVTVVILVAVVMRCKRKRHFDVDTNIYCSLPDKDDEISDL